MRYFEDFVVGQVERVGTHTVDRAELIAMAERWDPQAMHLGAAGEAPIAPGVLLMAITVRALVCSDPRPAVVAGLGWDEVRFVRPARPGDELTVERECIEARLSRTHPGRGIVRNRIRATNERAELVLSYVDCVLVACRGHDPAADRGSRGGR